MCCLWVGKRNLVCICVVPEWHCPGLTVCASLSAGGEPSFPHPLSPTVPLPGSQWRQAIPRTGLPSGHQARHPSWPAAPGVVFFFLPANFQVQGEAALYVANSYDGPQHGQISQHQWGVTEFSCSLDNLDILCLGEGLINFSQKCQPAILSRDPAKSAWLPNGQAGCWMACRTLDTVYIYCIRVTFNGPACTLAMSSRICILHTRPMPSVAWCAQPPWLRRKVWETAWALRNR